jgi:arsenite methyltransferase
MNTSTNSGDLMQHVREQYAEVARGELNNDSNAVRSIATAFGYSAEELQQLPVEANMGLSCGNPLALAGIRAGEVVVDLGCGGGMDVFLAARKVGPTGRVIGIDMTTEMLDRARAGQQTLGLTNVEFHQATIDQLPLPDNSVDCVISNCVINLVPDKFAVFQEIFRVLKPGGRVALSDIALRQELPSEVKHSVEAYVGCIAGAILIDEYRSQLERAGFQSVVVTDTGADLNAYAIAGNGGGCCGSISCCSEEKSLHDGLASVMQSFDANAYAASVRVHGLKHGNVPLALQRGAEQSGSELHFAHASAPIASTAPIAPTAECCATDRVATSIPVSNLQPLSQEKTMKTFQVYDKPMCCSTGVCGPEVDPVLPTFAADLDWLKHQGHSIERYNLAQQPQAFLDNKAIHQLLSTVGTDCLPVIVVDGAIVSQAVYPSRDDLANWMAGSPTKQMLPVAQTSGGCCGSSGCC